ncbi:MAG: cation:proton antiporter [Victivallales bacterium]|nr:cation:proton antiporter [Victivallales bacterium]
MSVIVMSVAIMLFCGFLATRVTKLFRLPNVTAYILIGIVLGPCCLDVIPANIIEGTDFISDIALAFIAFSSGEFFKFQLLRNNGMKLIVITLLESLIASLFVFILAFCFLHLSLAFSIILSALAAATAPASTMMTIRQTNSRGDYVDTLLSVVALDDIVSLVAFSVAVSVAVASMGGMMSTQIVLRPILLNIVLIIAGAIMGCVLKALMTAKRSTDNRLIVTVALLFGLCGIGAALDVSPLLACMTTGMVYTNLTDDGKLFRQINYFSPPILLLFFVRSGLQFKLNALFDIEKALAGTPLLVIGVLYFFVRIIGKYAGAWLGCFVVRKKHEVRDYLGLALIPQAGVAIGLAALGARIIGGETGGILQTIILSSSILYELVGPACAKLGLYLSHSYGKDLEETSETAPENAAIRQTDLSLKEQMMAIQSRLANNSEIKQEHRQVLSAPEPVPIAEDDEYYSILDYMRRHGKFINRR